MMRYIGFFIGIFALMGLVILPMHSFTQSLDSQESILSVSQNTYVSFNNQHVIPVPVYFVEPGKSAPSFMMPFTQTTGNVKILFRDQRPSVIQPLSAALTIDTITIVPMDYFWGTGTAHEIIAFCPHPKIAGYLFSEGPVFLSTNASDTFATKTQIPKESVTPFLVSLEKPDQAIDQTPSKADVIDGFLCNLGAQYAIPVQSYRYLKPFNFNSYNGFVQKRAVKREENRILIDSFLDSGVYIQHPVRTHTDIQVLSLSGTGMSTLVRLPNEDILIVDCGSKSDVQEVIQKIASVEQTLNKSLDSVQFHIVLTTLHSDAIGGFSALMEYLNTRVHSVMINSIENWSEITPKEDPKNSDLQNEEDDSEEESDKESIEESNEEENSSETGSNPVKNPSTAPMLDPVQQECAKKIDTLAQILKNYSLAEVQNETPLRTRFFQSSESQLKPVAIPQPEGLDETFHKSMAFTYLETGSNAHVIVSQNVSAEKLDPENRSLTVLIDNGAYRTLLPSDNYYQTLEKMSAYQSRSDALYMTHEQLYSQSLFHWCENVHLIYQSVNTPEVLEQSDLKNPLELIQQLILQAEEHGDEIINVEQENLGKLLQQMNLQYLAMKKHIAFMAYLDTFQYHAQFYFWNHHVLLDSPLIENALIQLFSVIKPTTIAFSIQKYYTAASHTASSLDEKAEASIPTIDYPGIYQFMYRVNQELSHLPFFTTMDSVCTVDWKSLLITFEPRSKGDGNQIPMSLTPDMPTVFKKILADTSLSDIHIIY